MPSFTSASSAIRAGHYRSGDALPSVRDAATALGVSRNPIREAIKGLELNYTGSYNHVTDNLVHAENESLTNTGRVAYAGSFLANRVNNLSLRVDAPGGTFYYGNTGMTGSTGANTTTSGGSADTRNNTQNVFVNNPTAGIWPEATT